MSKAETERFDDLGIAAWDDHKSDAFVELLADNFVWTDVTVPEPMRTRDEARRYVEAWFTAFPDMEVKRTHRIVSDEEVAAELEFTGTNNGELAMGGGTMPATGKPVKGKGAYFARVENGKITKFNTYPDVAGMLMQLGFLSQP
jgi:steroid delta-isomerase-like uncharacterized protein